MDRFLNTFRILEEEEELAAVEREEQRQLDEEQGFLSGSSSTTGARRARGGGRWGKRESVLTRWMPPRLKAFWENASRVKLVIAATLAFLLLLGSLSYLKRKYKLPVALPDENLRLSEELVERLEGTVVPEFVLTFAPLVILDKKDKFHPSDIATHLSNTYAAFNFAPIPDAPSPLALDNLDLLNSMKGEDVWLSSTTSIVDLPTFLHGTRPDIATLQTPNATSSVIIVVDKGEEVVDAFYMYFYSFNEGPKAIGHQVGNHLGDWEHNMIRFKAGTPQSIWYSQHEYGAAYNFNSVDKVGSRPVVFSARGTHANYPTPGKHDLHNQNAEIPRRVVYDQTSPGDLWDPTLAAFWYSFDASTGDFTGVGEKDGLRRENPEQFLYFKGRWGDEQLVPEAKGQEEFKGFWKWVGGPKGPLDKHLDRKEVCLPVEGENVRECVIRTTIH